MRIGLVIVGIVVGLAVGLPTWGEPSAVGTTPEPTAAAVSDNPASPSSLVGDEEAGSLLLDRGTVPITPPTEAVPMEVTPPPPVPESVVVDVRCRLMREPEGGWFLLDFLDPLPEGYPRVMRVLPGRELELLEAWAAENDRVQFRMTGQTTAYHDEAYVLPLSVARISRSEGMRLATPSNPATTEPAKTPTATTLAVDSDEAERIREMLTKNKPLRPSVPPPARREADAEGGAAPPAGDILINRTIRIAPAKNGPWLEARFEADNTLQEQPVPLLPCRLLEQAETIDGKMHITGVLRHYKGRDYLLLRKVLAERDMGQL